jgi:RNA polymerase sigma factor (TIGR02999 family)
VSTSADVTRALLDWQRGDPAAAEVVFTLVYDDLRVLARRHLSRLSPGQTLAPTMLVHEAFLRFAERSAPQAIDRQHFLAIASRAMRHVVIDHVRRRRAQKRDGGVAQPLDSSVAASSGPSTVDLLALDEALTRLEELDRRQARIVEMRYFAGIDLREIAALLQLSERTVKRDWQKARAFLYDTLR